MYDACELMTAEEFEERWPAPTNIQRDQLNVARLLGAQVAVTVCRTAFGAYALDVRVHDHDYDVTQSSADGLS